MLALCLSYPLSGQAQITRTQRGNPESAEVSIEWQDGSSLTPSKVNEHSLEFPDDEDQ